MKSTTGRTPISRAFRIAGWALRTLGCISPDAVDRTVLRLFSTPHRARRKGLAVPADAVLSFLEFEGRELAVWSMGAGPVVLLAHGWSGTAADLGNVAGVLRRAGYRAVLFDMPAHGRSSGRRTDLPQMARAIAAVAQFIALREPVHAVIGHSLGGAAVTLALRDGMRVGRAALVAPPGRAEVYLDRLTNALGFDARLRGRARAALAEYAGGDLGRVSAVVAARALSLPGLVIHDRADREVSWEEGRAIAESWSRAQLLVTEGLGHRRLLGNGDVLERLLDFVSQPASRLPPTPEHAPGARLRHPAFAHR